jgi:hypothetical protein
VAWFLFAIAAEMEGIGLAALCALLGTIAKAGGERLGEAEKIGPSEIL